MSVDFSRAVTGHDLKTDQRQRSMQRLQVAIVHFTLLLVLSNAQSKGDDGVINQFEDKVSQLITKIMNSKHLLSEKEATILEDRLNKFGKALNSTDDLVRNFAQTKKENGTSFFKIIIARTFERNKSGSGNGGNFSRPK